MTTVGERLLELLAAYGVEFVFGIPGVHTLELYRGLAASRIRHVTARHEQAAGFMADGYARVSGKPGVCFVITGPGLANAATAMAQAYADSIPLLVISGVNAAGRMNSGAGFLHELPDQRALARSVAAFSHTVLRAEELAPVIARAFAVFDAGRPRPVHIEIPVDVMAQPAAALPASVVRLARPVPAARELALAAGLIGAAKTPVLVVGGGVVRAAENIRSLAERLDAPVVMTINARGVLPPTHPLGIAASPSLKPVRECLAAADLVLALGTELGPTDFDIYDEGRLASMPQLVRVDIDPEQLARNYPAALGLVGDAGAACAALSRLVPQRPRGGGALRAGETRRCAREALDAGAAQDVALIESVRDVLPEAVIVGDSTRQVYAGNLFFAAAGPVRWFNASVGFGALGFGLPAAIGASLAAPERPVVCLAGDGGLQFTLAELGTAVEAGARLIVILLNNRGYGEIRSTMLARHIEPVGVDLHTPDFQAIAGAYGWASERLTGAEALPDLLRSAAARTLPTLLEIHAQPSH
ncbi:MAG: 5-guanidino-2-oxopentanoate decarboxylase [Steroidobacteraceae bacterium]